MIRSRHSYAFLVFFCFFSLINCAPHSASPLLTSAAKQITFKKIRPADMPELLVSINSSTMKDQELFNQKISLTTYTEQYAKVLAITYCIDRLETVAHELGHVTVGTLLGGRVAKIHIPLLPFSNAYCKFSEMPRYLPELMSTAGPCAGALCAYGIQRMFPRSRIVQDQARSEIRSNFYNFIPVRLTSGSITDGARIVESFAKRTDFSLLKECPTIPSGIFLIGIKAIDNYVINRR